MNDEIHYADGWTGRFFETGCQRPDQKFIDDCLESLRTLCLQSEYSPSEKSLVEFVSDVFASTESRAEKLMLGILFSPDLSVHGLIQVRYFDESADLDFILIDRHFRRLGFARILLEKMHQILRSVRVRKVFLEVSVANQSAIKLYQQIGYSEISIRKAYYRNGEDALVMEKSL